MVDGTVEMDGMLLVEMEVDGTLVVVGDRMLMTMIGEEWDCNRTPNMTVFYFSILKYFLWFYNCSSNTFSKLHW